MSQTNGFLKHLLKQHVLLKLFIYKFFVSMQHWQLMLKKIFLIKKLYEDLTGSDVKEEKKLFLFGLVQALHDMMQL